MTIWCAWYEVAGSTTTYLAFKTQEICKAACCLSTYFVTFLLDPLLDAESYENIMHCTGHPAINIWAAADGTTWPHQRCGLCRAAAMLRSELAGPRLERAIGVIYRPDTERFSHYFQT